MLTLTAGVIGILISQWAADALIAFSPVTFPGFVRVNADPTVLAFTFGVSTTMGLLLGLAPMWQMGGGSLSSTLKRGGRGNSGGGRLLFRQAIVTAEIALAVILLVGAGLLIRQSVALNAIDPGYDVERLLTMNVSLPAPAGTPAGAPAGASGATSGQPASGGRAAGSAAPQSALAIAERVGAVPGVERAGLGCVVDSADGIQRDQPTPRKASRRWGRRIGRAPTGIS